MGSLSYEARPAALRLWLESDVSTSVGKIFFRIFQLFYSFHYGVHTSDLIPISSLTVRSLSVHVYFLLCSLYSYPRSFALVTRKIGVLVAYGLHRDVVVLTACSLHDFARVRRDPVMTSN